MTHKEYEERRNALIPEAAKYANEIHGRRAKHAADHEGWAAQWNRTFFLKMDELARAGGLVNGR